MRKTIKLAVVAALALGATSAFATNGDNLIATGAKARAMGGVGIATSFGAESSIANPALLSSVKSSEFSGSITAFMPDVAIRDTTAFGGAGTLTDSKADFSLIPEFAYASRINSNLVYGVSVTGTAGMGVDNDNATANVNRMKTELGLMKVAIPVSYQMGELSLGVAPIMQYGTLDISHWDAFGQFQDNKGKDITFGFEIGAAYEATSDWTVGVVYKSELAMKYKNVLSRSITSFAADAAFNPGNGITSGDNLTQPSEYGVGASYSNGANTLAVDYKRVNWGSAAGYEDFGWQDQDIYSLGYEYATKAWSLRAGYNYSKSPIKEQTGGAGGAVYRNHVTNFFNLSGFPGIVESHYTCGAGYNMSDDLSLDLAVVYAAEEKNSYATDSFMPGSKAEVVHSQLGLTVGATYTF